MLHIVNQSPTERPALATCLRLARKGDSILLIEDGVYAAVENPALVEQTMLSNGQFKLFVLAPDLQARGLQNDKLIQGFEVVNYAGFVDLVAANQLNQSWL